LLVAFMNRQETSPLNHRAITLHAKRFPVLAAQIHKAMNSITKTIEYDMDTTFIAFISVMTIFKGMIMIETLNKSRNNNHNLR
jgi:hypothetical protein